MKNLYRKNPNLTKGILGVIVIVLAGILAFTLAESGIGKREFTAYFDNAGGIRPGDKVKIAGVNVGEVSDTELDGNRVKVTLEVEKRIRVKTDGLAKIKLSTLLGQRYIDLAPGVAAEDSSKVIPHTSIPYDLQKIIELAGPRIEKIDEQKLGSSIKLLNSQLKNAPSITKPTLDALASLSKVIYTRGDQINNLINDVDAVTAIVQANSLGISHIVSQGRSLAQKIMYRETMVTHLLNGLAEVTREAQIIGVDNNNNLGKLIANIDVVSQGLEKNRKNLRNLLEVLPVTLRYANNILGQTNGITASLPWGIIPDNWLCLVQAVKGCRRQ